MNSKSQRLVFGLLLLATILLFLADIALGAVSIPISEVFKSLFGMNPTQSRWEYIILNYRLPKAITAILTGMGLSVSGLLMQTLFKNPLAGPYVLGLSSGASLGVAFLVLGAGLLPVFLIDFAISPYALVLASCFGSTVVLFGILLLSRWLRDTMSLLIVGLMLGSFTTAIVGILTYFSSAEQLQKFTFWSLGNLGNLSWISLLLLSICVIGGLLLALLCLKSLDALLLGENYAKSMGLNYKKSRLLIMLATGLLVGSITSFAGPIAFIGMSVPHIARLLLKTSKHFPLYLASLLIGAGLLLFCDILCQVPGTDITLPINAITSVIGAPVVIYLLLGRRKLFN